MSEYSSSSCSFIDDTRAGTLLAGELLAKERRKREKDAEGNDSDTKPKHKHFNDAEEGEWFIDAEDDEELMDAMLQKHHFARKKTDSILLCPACFATLCNLCQQHEQYHDQYRALIVTNNVRVSKKNPKLWKDDQGVCFEYWTALCRTCDVEVGTYDPLEEMYHFHDVLPSR